MEIKLIEPGRELTQWDTDRYIELDEAVDEVHFANIYYDKAMVVEPQNNLAPIPNILLQYHAEIYVYLVVHMGNGKRTIYHSKLGVKKRTRPSDYVYTETEVRSYEALESRVQYLEENQVSDDKVKDAVESYLDKNPVKANVDDALSEISENPVQNKVVTKSLKEVESKIPTDYVSNEELEKKKYLTEHQDLSNYAKKESVPTTPEAVGAEPKGTADTKIGEHNTSNTAHSDIRASLKELITKVTTLLDCDDETLDQTSEIVKFAKDNRDLISQITTSKVNVDDIVNNLTTNVSNKPLSAAQGVAILGLISDLEKSLEDLPGGETIEVDAELKEYMNTVKPKIKQAIINKGGNVEETDSFGDYATRINEIPNGIYAAEDLPSQATLVATYNSTDPAGIILNFTDVGADGYLIVRKENEKPDTSADGTIVYNGAYKENVTDASVEIGKTYYYRIYPRNSKNQYQSIEGSSVAICEYKSREAQKQAKDLALGETVALGYYGQVFTWEVVDTKDATGPILAANQNCGNKQWDVAENDSTTPNPITARKNSGNNRWAFSNVRQWLNSDAAKGEWYIAQHEYDMPPNYKTEAGFLNAFTDAEKVAISLRVNKCILDANDGGGTETVEDLIWLPSTQETGKEVTREGYTFEAYDGTAASTAYQSNWWQRTIQDATGNKNTACVVRFVNSGGAVGYGGANGGSVAVRPFCQLVGDTWLVWSELLEAYILADDSQRTWEA